MVYDPNIAPTNIEEWNELVIYYYNLSQQKYGEEITKLSNLALNEYSKIQNNTKSFDQFLGEILSSIERPKTIEQIEQEYNYLRPLENEELPEINPVPLYETIYKIGERYWSIKERKFIPEPIEKNNVIQLAGKPTIDNLRAALILYGKSDPLIQLGPEIMTIDELFTSLRNKRDEYFSEYDKKIAQLDRLIRENPDNIEYQTKRKAWDNYANELVALTDEGREGAPWDGGGPLTPWPEKPA